MQVILVDNSVDISRQISKKRFISFDQECDNIILQNGEEVMSKVLEVTVNETKYKRCDNLDGPVYSIKKSEVFMIKYANGTKDVFTIEKAVIADSKKKVHTKDGPKDEPMGIVALIMGIVAWLVPVFALAVAMCAMATVFGVASMSKIQKNPEVYKGKGFAIAALMLGIAGLIILLAIGID